VVGSGEFLFLFFGFFIKIFMIVNVMRELEKDGTTMINIERFIFCFYLVKDVAWHSPS